MKKLLASLLLLCFYLASNAQNEDFKIKMKIDGMKDSSCYLINYFGNQRYYKDTSSFNSNGIVIFSGKEQHPGGIYGVYTGGKLLFEFVINEAQINLKTDTNDYVGNMIVEKSEENKVFFDHLKLVTKKQKESEPLREILNDKSSNEKEKKKANKRLEEIGEEINNYRINIIEKKPNLFVSKIFKTMRDVEAPEFNDIKNDSIKKLTRYQYLKDHYFDNIDFSDARINYTPIYHNKLESFFKNVVYPIPDSVIKEVDIVIEKSKANKDIFKYTLHYLLTSYEKSKMMGMDAVFSHIGIKYYTHELAYWADSTQIEKVKERANKIAPLIIGKQAINLSLLDTSGLKWVNMYKEVDAKYTVLIFWDPDCGHCKKELPKLGNYIDSVKSTIDIKVYSVSSSHSDEWKKFITDNKLDFINVAVPKEVYENKEKATEYIVKGFTDIKSLNYSTTYDIYSTPQVYLLDRSKKIIAKKLDTDLLKKIVGNLEKSKKN